jgi:hypothetical protein
MRLSQLTYPQWSQDLQYLLQGAGAFNIVFGLELAPPVNQHARLIDFQRREGLAVSFIYNSCGAEGKRFFVVSLARLSRCGWLWWPNLIPPLPALVERGWSASLIALNVVTTLLLALISRP